MPKATKRIFLVVSYDDDQQQWFYDSVLAKTESEASQFICDLRPYVMGADATSLQDVKDWPIMETKSYTFDASKPISEYETDV